MGWFETEDWSWLFYAVVLTLGALIILLLAFVWWTSRMERRRVRRHVESLGGEVLSIHRVGFFSPGSGFALDESPGPWHEDSDAPTYRVCWRTRDGVEASGEFKARYYRRSVWPETLPEDPAARKRRFLLRPEPEPRQPGDVPGDERVRW
jgi:hypothetical protein